MEERGHEIVKLRLRAAGVYEKYLITRDTVLIVCWSETKSGIGLAVKSLGIDIDTPRQVPIHDVNRFR